MSEAERAGTSRQDKSARLLAGRYRLGDVLGRGGMGTVWRAEDETLGRTVAVKELRFPSNIDEEEKRRLITRTLREAKAIARIRNTSAVTVFDVVQEDDRPWIVMELVEGKSLAEVIREDGLLEPRRAAEVGLAVLDVLRSAHREGILHRDVKPSNVLIADDGRVVLTDFGIAQVEGDPSITSTGMLVGAPSYISPERARGHKPGPAADLWSLGGLLYAAVEGTPPYDKGSAIATLTAVMTEPLEEPKNAGPLRDVIHGLLNKDPAQRLDDRAARAMLTAVISAPDAEDADGQPTDATRVVPLPEQPGTRDTGAKRGEEAAEKLRGALRSVRKAAVAAGAARTKSGTSTSASTPASTSTSASASGAATRSPDATPAAARSVTAASPAAGTAGGARGADAATGGRSSGWPVMTPPDLPARPAPRASITDVVPRRTLVVIALVVVLAVIGTVLALTLGDDEDGKGAQGAGGDRTVAESTPSAETRKDDEGGTRTDGSATASTGTGASAGASPGSTGTGGGSAPGSSSDAAGGGTGETGAARTYRGQQGYSIGLPAGWTYKSSGDAGDRFTGPNGQKLLIGWTTTPKDDPVADWTNQERFMVRSQYKRIRIVAVEYRGWKTADWEFTYVDGGVTYRSVDRGTVVNDGLGYGLFYTARADAWDGEQRKNTWRTLTETFRPKS
ncbi:serine/threonine-protein kinase [Streptomyces sp. DH20]|uniref:serine/threonine-protein kinase n=1 Tax=Streptomyces sp. DH20 TaxID=2857009 RepID=UPI001E58F522|nr:serine/threonine-protein kinase [Streptomyces sp. DH20]